ncbi:MAG: hypothetical protein KKD44_22875 [Proteobacteria bacterium]|nr:hypothetical protein [Pseudomonadota bacterium]
MKHVFFLILLVIIPASCLAIEEMNDNDLNMVTAQDGVTVILEDFKITHHMGLMSIGGEDGLGIPSAPEGAWFVFDSTRILELNVERGCFDIDALTTGASGYDLGAHGDSIAGNTSSVLISFNEAYFHINMTDALLTLKFANNPQGLPGDGVTTFSDTVCNFALNGSTITIKSDDAKMFIFPH